MDTVEKPRGRAPRTHEGDRLTRSEIASVLKSSRRTVADYLSRKKYPDAPLPDDDQRYSLAEYKAHYAKHGPRASGEAMLLLKEDILRIEKEERAMKLAIKKGLYLSKQEAAQTISPLMAELGDMLRSKFVLELPAKAVGRSAADIQVLCELYLSDIIKRFREGTNAISG